MIRKCERCNTIKNLGFKIEICKRCETEIKKNSIKIIGSAILEGEQYLQLSPQTIKELKWILGVL